MYTVGRTEEDLDAKGLAFTANKNSTDYVGKFEKHDLMFKLKNYLMFNQITRKHHYKSHTFVPVHVIMIMKPWKNYTKNLKKLLTRNVAGASNGRL